MKALISHVGTCLALAAGLVVAAGVASAQATKRPISGQGDPDGCWVLPPSQQEDRRIWSDADGVLHVRNQKQECEISGDIEGISIGYDNYNYDPATGQVDSHGNDVFVGEILGELASATIRWQNECDTDAGVTICHEEDVWHFDNGSVAKITWDIDTSVPPPLPWTGTLLDPPGRN